MKSGPAIVTVLAAFAAVASADVPKLDSVFPSGGKRGSEVELTITGTFKPWPAQVWFSVEGLGFEPDPKKNGMGMLSIPADLPPGPVLMRVFNEEGASEPTIFVIGEREEVNEEEKDKSTVTGAPLLEKSKLPLVVNGTLSASQELDSYRLALKKGETLFAAVEAYSLRSPVDPALHIYDDAGNRLALVHDGPTNLDPGIAFTAPEEGEYIVALAGFSHPPASSVSYTGAKTARYRLHLGLNRDHLPARLFPADPGPDSKGETIEAGKPVVGTLAPDRAESRYTFHGKKNESLLVKVEGRVLGYPIDPVLRILKADGSEIRREDDTNKLSDPEYLWKVSADGDYTITVADRFGRGGEGMRYRLSLAPPVPDFEVKLDKATYVLERGKPLAIKATLTRLHGHDKKLTVSISGLPSGITFTPPKDMPEKNGEVSLQLEAPAKAKPFSGPIRIQFGAEGEKAKKDAVFSFTNDNYRGPYLMEATPDVWLTLAPEKEKKEDEKATAEKATAEKKK